MKSLLLSVSTLIALSSSIVWAQTLPHTRTSEDINITTQERYSDTGFNKNSLKSNLTIKGHVDFNGFVEITAIVQSGNYNSSFNTIYDMDAGKFNQLDGATQLYIKKLYLKKTMMNGNLTTSLGALENRTSIAQTNALSNAGWVDGTRVELKTNLGLMTMTAGQINASNPNSLTRLEHLDFNYFEITLNRQIFDKLLVEGGLEVLDGKPLIEVASKYDIEIATDKVIKLVADLKLDAQSGGTKFGVGVQDVISIFSTKPNPIKLAVNYEYVSSGFNPSINKLYNLMHSGYTGGAIVTAVQFPISKKLALNGFTNLRVGSQKSDFRIETGLVKTLFNKNSKKN
ncbi:MAG: hypothetical protein H7235_01310 [Bdellovibrionaceae bacterium]|nr:hypothetical protein [Pseudobdellovibrionaceae bacterium]